MLDQPARREPRPGVKCHSTAINRPGFLTVSTSVVCAADPCIVNGAGDTQQVRVVNDSPLQYFVDVRSRCLTGGINYVHDGVQEDTWNEERVFVPARRRSRRIRPEPGRTPDLHRQLIALTRRDDESIEVAVSWSCVGNVGNGSFAPPLTIQVDARSANR